MFIHPPAADIMSEADLKEQKRIQQAEYARLPHRMAKSRADSSERCRQKKIITTSRRFEEHPIGELMMMAVMKCHELGIDYSEHEPLFLRVFEIMHTTAHDQSIGRDVDIITTQPTHPA